LHKPDGWRYTGKGAIVPITFDDDGIPYVEAVLSVPTKPNLPAHMALDFGAADTITLTSPFAKANDLINLAGTNTNVLTTAGLEKQFFTQSKPCDSFVPQICERLNGGVGKWLTPAVLKNEIAVLLSDTKSN
jgi:hypothetical protein